MKPTYFTKQDGRDLWLYGRYGDGPIADADMPPTDGGSDPHRRFHPLLGEWVSYAGARQGRTFLPPADQCPLCPAKAEGEAKTEVPFTDFEVAVFQNRFPAFAQDAIDAPVIEGLETAPAVGRCEVVVFGPDHGTSLSQLSEDRIALLLKVWADRILDLRDKAGFEFVLPFENRGEEIGVTLHHPHGQIYAFDFLPDEIRRRAEAAKAAPVMDDLQARLAADLVLKETDGALGFVPPVARYPYEVWIAPKSRKPGPWALSAEETTDMAACLKDALMRLDALFDKPMPYVMAVLAAPKGYDDCWPFLIELRPIRRAADKLKYLAGVEQITGLFLADVPPEQAAQALRDAL